MPRCLHLQAIDLSTEMSSLKFHDRQLFNSWDLQMPNYLFFTECLPCLLSIVANSTIMIVPPKLSRKSPRKHFEMHILVAFRGGLQKASFRYMKHWRMVFLATHFAASDGCYPVCLWMTWCWMTRGSPAVLLLPGPVGFLRHERISSIHIHNHELCKVFWASVATQTKHLQMWPPIKPIEVIGHLGRWHQGHRFGSRLRSANTFRFKLTSGVWDQDLEGHDKCLPLTSPPFRWVIAPRHSLLRLAA